MASLLRQCTANLYSAIGHENARTACVFTSLTLADALRGLGHEARPAAAAVEGRMIGRRFGIGHPSYPLARPGAWKGHLVCMVGDILIDPTISQVRRLGVEVPLLVAVRADRPWVPDARCTLSPGLVVTWQAEGANEAWTALSDAAPALRAPAVARLLARLRAPDGRVA